MENKIIVDIAEIISLVGASFVALVFFLLRRYIAQWDSDLKQVQRDVNYIKDKFSMHYVRRDDFKEQLNELRALMKEMKNDMRVSRSNF